VLSAASAEDARCLASAHAGPIDLLLTDVVMPDMDGSALVEQLEAMRRQLRVIYMSGYAEGAVAHRGVLKDGRPFVQKPFTGDALLGKVREVLDAP
jgi:CheY-like chemotaxis protein